jgi:hypothetical protein
MYARVGPQGLKAFAMYMCLSFSKEASAGSLILIVRSATVWTIAGATILECMLSAKCFCVDMLTDFFLVVDGLAHIGEIVFGELLRCSQISDSAIRKVSRSQGRCSMKFHLPRQTGGLTRAIERGTKYVLVSSQFLLCLIIV